MTPRAQSTERQCGAPLRGYGFGHLPRACDPAPPPRARPYGALRTTTRTGGSLRPRARPTLQGGPAHGAAVTARPAPLFRVDRFVPSVARSSQAWSPHPLNVHPRPEHDPALPSRSDTPRAITSVRSTSGPTRSITPDTRTAGRHFYGRSSGSPAVATKAGVERGERIRIEAPLLKLSKAEIVRLGERLGVPWHLTWSCYAGGQRACGRCDACRLRDLGFSTAGVLDPVRRSPTQSRRITRRLAGR